MVHHKVSTICGNVQTGCHDGDSTVAQFNNPIGVAVDLEGNFIVVDSGYHLVRKVSPGGVVSTLAGDGNRGFKDGRVNIARFNFGDLIFAGSVIDSDGNTIIADSENHRIRKISADGSVSTLAGTGKKGHRDGLTESAFFESPTGVAVDCEGNVVVSDIFNYCIRRITRAGYVSTIAGKPGCPGFVDGRGAEALFSVPLGISVDRHRGFIYVADLCNQCIRRISPEGDVTTVAGNGTEGNTLGPNALSSCLSEPIDCAVDGDGNIIICTKNSNRLLKVTVDGQISCLAGDGSKGLQDGPADQASFNNPCGIAINHSGDIVVCDKGNQTLRLISAGLTPPETFARQTEDSEDEISISNFLANQTLNPQFSDVKVHVGKKTFHAHANLLSRSPFFNAALTHELLEGSHREVTMKDMEPDTFRHVLDYIYTDKCNFSSRVDMLQLYAAAEFLGLSKLKRTCESEIYRRLKVENVVQCFRHAVTYSLDNLKRRCVRVASESVSSLTRAMLTAEYVDFMQNEPTLHEEFLQACNAK